MAIRATTAMESPKILESSTTTTTTTATTTPTIAKARATTTSVMTAIKTAEAIRISKTTRAKLTTT
jgi:hypothetical protein